LRHLRSALTPRTDASTAAGAARPPTEHRGSGVRHRIYVPVLVFLFSRLTLLCVARVAERLLGASGPNPSVLPTTDPLAHAWSWTSPWFRFDTGWYVGIAQHGYHWGPLGTANTNFMPLYPILIKVLEPITLGSPWIAAWLIANVAALVATVLLWHWAVERWGAEVGMRALILVTFFPFAFFLAAPYAEPLFLVVALAAFMLAERDRWIPAACCAGLCTITRPVGVAVVLALVLTAAYRGRPQKAIISGLAVLPLLAFSAYLGLEFGHPLGFLSYHSAGWQPPRGGTWNTISTQLSTSLSPWDRVDAAVTVLFLGSVPLIWQRIGPGYAAYTLVGVALPLIHGLVSMERYVGVLFPAMAAWSLLRSKVVQMSLLAVSVVGLFFSTTLFAAGYSIF
jgi:hypothetical protein